MSFNRAPITVSAVFTDEHQARAAEADLHRLGLPDRSVHLIELDPGRYQLEDEFDADRSWRVRIDLVIGGLVGAVLGILIVAFAIGTNEPLAYVAGGLAGIMFGAVVGGVIASAWGLPIDDDEDAWVDVPEGTHRVMLEARTDIPGLVRQARHVMERHGATGFLATGPVGLVPD